MILVSIMAPDTSRSKVSDTDSTILAVRMSKFISQTIANYIHFMAQEVHNFKLCFSSFSHQKEKFRVTAITLILGGKSDISVEG